MPGAVGTKPDLVDRGRVLVVDDDGAVLRAMTRLLSSDHDVVALDDSREALRRLVDESEAFDVVFCDLMMPHVTGMELFTRVRVARPSLASRFVFVTGGTMTEEGRAFLADVPNERLEKPFSNQNLRGIARRFIEQRVAPFA